MEPLREPTIKTPILYEHLPRLGLESKIPQKILKWWPGAKELKVRKEDGQEVSYYCTRGKIDHFIQNNQVEYSDTPVFKYIKSVRQASQDTMSQAKPQKTSWWYNFLASCGIKNQGSPQSLLPSKSIPKGGQVLQEPPEPSQSEIKTAKEIQSLSSYNWVTPEDGKKMLSQVESEKVYLICLPEDLKVFPTQFSLVYRVKNEDGKLDTKTHIITIDENNQIILSNPDDSAHWHASVGYQDFKAVLDRIYGSDYNSAKSFQTTSPRKLLEIDLKVKKPKVESESTKAYQITLPHFTINERDLNTFVNEAQQLLGNFSFEKEQAKFIQLAVNNDANSVLQELKTLCENLRQISSLNQTDPVSLSAKLQQAKNEFMGKLVSMIKKKDLLIEQSVTSSSETSDKALKAISEVQKRLGEQNLSFSDEEINKLKQAIESNGLSVAVKFSSLQYFIERGIEIKSDPRPLPERIEQSKMIFIINNLKAPEKVPTLSISEDELRVLLEKQFGEGQSFNKICFVYKDPQKNNLIKIMEISQKPFETKTTITFLEPGVAPQSDGSFSVHTAKGRTDYFSNEKDLMARLPSYQLQIGIDSSKVELRRLQIALKEDAFTIQELQSIQDAYLPSPIAAKKIIDDFIAAVTNPQPALDVKALKGNLLASLKSIQVPTQ